MKPKIFLLEPKQKENRPPKLIIWAKDEKTARDNANYTSAATEKNQGFDNYITQEDLNFYQNSGNAKCTEILVEKDDVKYVSNNTVQLKYEGKTYELTENEAEEIENS